MPKSISLNHWMETLCMEVKTKSVTHEESVSIQVQFRVGMTSMIKRSSYINTYSHS